ncbi:MAG: hypothetical protein KKG76_07260 [Euryarchaeota archaeon]|nr:hypothetical protein [Euryarchaeota archaeon]
MDEKNSKNISLKEWINLLPSYIKQVDPFWWIFIVALVGITWHLGGPAEFMPFRKWLVSHIMIIGGLIFFTIWAYNNLNKKTVMYIVSAVWLITGGTCIVIAHLFSLVS